MKNSCELHLTGCFYSSLNELSVALFNFDCFDTCVRLPALVTRLFTMEDRCDEIFPKFVHCILSCVLYVRRLDCDGLTTRPEESHRVSKQIKKPPVCEAVRDPYRDCKKAI
jgi:hypothetical protein